MCIYVCDVYMYAYGISTYVCVRCVCVYNTCIHMIYSYDVCEYDMCMGYVNMYVSYIHMHMVYQYTHTMFVCTMHVYIYDVQVYSMMYVLWVQCMCISAFPRAQVRKLCTSSSAGGSTFEAGIDLITSLHLKASALVKPLFHCRMMA